MQTVLAFPLLQEMRKKDEGKDSNVSTEEEHVFLVVELL